MRYAVGRKIRWAGLLAPLGALVTGAGCGSMGGMPTGGGTITMGPTGPASAMLIRATDDSIESLLRSEGIKYERLGDGKFKLNLSGKTAVLSLVNSGESLLLMAYFSDRIPVEKVNKWNEKARLLKAHIDSDGDLAMESSFFFFGGVSQQAIPKFVRAFELDMVKLMGFLSE